MLLDSKQEDLISHCVCDLTYQADKCSAACSGVAQCQNMSDLPRSGADCLLVHAGAVLSVRRGRGAPPPRSVRALRLCERLALNVPGGTAGGLEREGPGAVHRALSIALGSGDAAALAAALDGAASADAAALQAAQ